LRAFLCLTPALLQRRQHRWGWNTQLALPLIAQALGFAVEALVAEAPKPKKRRPAPKLQQQLERLQALPKAKQRLVIEELDSLLAHSGR
jgi:hypothetical protein